MYPKDRYSGASIKHGHCTESGATNCEVLSVFSYMLYRYKI